MSLAGGSLARSFFDRRSSALVIIGERDHRTKGHHSSQAFVLDRGFGSGQTNLEVSRPLSDA